MFAGSFPVEAAESVCEAKVSELSALVDLSLLKPIGDERLLMLETIREYGLERLAESGEEETFRTRHAEEFARLAEAAYELRDQAEVEWSSRLDRDHDDLRAALDWLSKTDPDAALELAGALGWFWFTRGYLAEGDARLRATLDASAANGRVRARALAASGALAARIGMVDEGRQRELWHSGAIAAVLVLLVLFSAWQHFELLRHGYQVEEKQREKATLDETGRQLRLEIETLRALPTHGDVVADRQRKKQSLLLTVFGYEAKAMRDGVGGGSDVRPPAVDENGAA